MLYGYRMHIHPHSKSAYSNALRIELDNLEEGKEGQDHEPTSSQTSLLEYKERSQTKRKTEDSLP